MRLIDADKAVEYCRKRWGENSMTEKFLNSFETVEAVPLAAHEQVAWERNVAMLQLEEHGIPFGGIEPDIVKVVRCLECKHYEPDEICSPGSGSCCFCEMTRNFDDYCSYGVRRANDGNET